MFVLSFLYQIYQVEQFLPQTPLVLVDFPLFQIVLAYKNDNVVTC